MTRGDGSSIPAGRAVGGNSAERMCRCELTIPAAILEGYACGRPDCWRTEPVAESFDAFVADLRRNRDDKASAPVVEPA